MQTDNTKQQMMECIEVKKEKDLHWHFHYRNKNKRNCQELPKNYMFVSNHPQYQIIGNSSNEIKKSKKRLNDGIKK